jgi:hypothetical protein
MVAAAGLALIEQRFELNLKPEPLNPKSESGTSEPLNGYYFWPFFDADIRVR